MLLRTSLFDHGIFNNISSNVTGNENKLNENEGDSPLNDDLADIAVHNDVQPSNAESFYNGNSCLRWKVEGFCEYLNIRSFILSVSEEQQKFTNVSENFHEEMIHFRTLYPKNLISGHININGFRNKFYEISDLLTQSLLDILFVSETKLDMSFPNVQFNVPEFKCHRADRNSRGGGIIAYVRNDLPHRRRDDLEILVNLPVEALVIEIMVRKEAWLFICLYSPHNKHKNICCQMIDALLEKTRCSAQLTFVIGDLNINGLCENEFRCLQDVIDVYDMFNIVDKPTCFKTENNTLLDVILISNRQRIAGTLNVNTGISDFHNLIAFSSKMHVPKTGDRNIQYRSYKHFNDEIFKDDIASAPYHVGDIFDDFDDTYWFNHMLIKNVIDYHAPPKSKRTVKRPLPFMNSQLRKACHRKSMLRNKYFKCGRTQLLSEQYRKSRNLVTKLKAKSMADHFSQRCSAQHLKKNPSKFWDTIKPFMTNKSKSCNENTSLKHNGKIVNNPDDVCDIFNGYFTNVAHEIGSEEILNEDEELDQIFKMYQNHASIARIQEHVSIDSPFKFANVSVGEVKSLLRNIDSSKATGYDTIPPKLVKAAANELAQPISSLVNMSLSLSRFPHELKKSETSPLYKGQNNLEPQNYRPLSVLTCLSKIFERVYNDQMGVYFKDILSTLLSAFRKRYGCPHVLTKLMENVKQALDEGENVGLILLDLSKAFDCLPHRLLLCKLNAYGVSYDACSLIKSYLCQRLQRVKVASA